MAKFIEVCDIPFCGEPSELFEKRVIIEKVRIEELRKRAAEILKKPMDRLTKEDYLIVEFELWPYLVNLNGKEYRVKYKKYKGRWILSCNCPAWIFNHSGNRTCKHTKAVAQRLNIPEVI